MSFVNRFLSAALLVAPLALLPTLLSPALVLMSAPEFKVPLESWGYLTIAFVGITILVSLLVLLFKQSLQPWIGAFLGAAFLVGFVVVIYFPEGGRRLDGIAAADMSRSYYLSTYLAYAIGIITLTFLLKQFESSLKWLSQLAFVVAIGIVCYVVINQDAPDVASNTSDNADLSPGQDANVIFVIADMLQGSAVEQFLNLEAGVTSDLGGFAVYTRATSPFPFTNFGLPSILSGELYSLKEPKDFRQNLEAARRNSFITDAQTAGFDSLVVGFDQLRITEDQFSYQEDTNPVFISALLADLGLTRLTKLSGVVAEPTAGTKMLVNLKRESLSLFERWAETEIGEANKKITVVHNFIPHSPTYFSKSNLVQPKLDWRVAEPTVPNYFEEMSFFFSTLIDVLEHLKSLGIYEDSLIIVAGDHGHFIGGQSNLYAAVPGAEDFKGYERGGWARAASMYNPVIMVKPPNSKGGAVIRRDPVSVLDLRNLVAQYVSKISVDLEGMGTGRSSNVVVTFKADAVNPYVSVQDHNVIEFDGNVAALPELFAQGGIVRYPYNIGEVASPPNKLLDGNWSKEEGKGAWLLDYPGRMFLSTPGLNGSHKYSMKLEVSGLVSREHPNQRVRVEVNNVDLGLIEINRETEFVTIPLPRKLTQSRPKELDISFTPLDAVSPKDLGLWDTASPVSMYIRSFAIEEFQDNLGYVVGTILSPANSVLFGEYSKESGKGAWLRDRQSEIRLKLAPQELDREVELVINGTPLVSENHPVQRVKVTIKDKFIGVLEFREAKTDQSIRVPRVLIPSSGSELVIGLVPLDAVSPRELDKWDNDSKISVYIYAVSLKVASD